MGVQRYVFIEKHIPIGKAHWEKEEWLIYGNVRSAKLDHVISSGSYSVGDGFGMGIYDIFPGKLAGLNAAFTGCLGKIDLCFAGALFQITHGEGNLLNDQLTFGVIAAYK